MESDSFLQIPNCSNYEGTELLLISAAEDIQAELGVELDVEHESGSAAIFKDLQIGREPRSQLLGKELSNGSL